MADFVNLSDWVAADRRIEEEAQSKTLALMEHRYKAISEGGFSIHEYAAALGSPGRGVRQQTINAYVRGYDLWRNRHGVTGTCDTPTDALELAKMSVERREAHGIVAEAKGVSIQQVRKAYQPDVQRVRDVIDREAERTGDREQAVAKARAYQERTERIARAQADQHARDRANKTRTALNIEHELGKSRKGLQNALLLARESDLGDEEVELIQDTLGSVRRLLELVNLAVIGQTEVDWDAELAKIA